MGAKPRALGLVLEMEFAQQIRGACGECRRLLHLQGRRGRGSLLGPHPPEGSPAVGELQLNVGTGARGNISRYRTLWREKRAGSGLHGEEEKAFGAWRGPGTGAKKPEANPWPR
jgi:hypothetical protein